MLWIFTIVVVLVLGGVVIVAAGHGDGLGPTHDDRRDVLVPTSRPLNGEDLRRLRFTVAWRGYRASEVDAVMARLQSELSQRDTAPAALVPADEPAVSSENDAAVGGPDSTDATAQDDHR